jgi:hypothetical protein
LANAQGFPGPDSGEALKDLASKFSRANRKTVR